MTALRIYDHEIGDPFAALNAYRQRRREARQREKAASTPPRKPEPASAPVAPPETPENVYRIVGHTHKSFNRRVAYPYPIGPRRPCSYAIIYEYPIGPVQENGELPMPPIHWRSIMEWVSEETGVPVAAIMSERRNQEVCLARFKFCYLVQREKQFSLPRIGKLLGGRDHTTVLHAVNRAKGLIEKQLWCAPSSSVLRYWAMQRRGI